MEKHFVINKNIETEKRVERYLLKYVNDLKLHFNLNDKQILKMLTSTSNKIRYKNPRNRLLETALLIKNMFKTF